LLRWHDNELGYVNPLEAFDAAKKTEHIPQLTDLLFEQIICDIKYWSEQSFKLVPVSFNLHPDILKNESKLLGLLDNLDHSDLPKESVIFEVTEDCVLGENSGKTSNLLRLLVSRGFRLSLDDFGTGFASLTHLKDLPSQEIKIDRSFVLDITENPESESIVKALLAIAGDTGKAVVAEGIETVDQLNLLKHLGCQIGQGFLFSKAVSTEEILTLIKRPQPFLNQIGLFI